MEHLHPNDDYLRLIHKFCAGCGNGIILHTLIRSLKNFIAKHDGLVIQDARSKSARNTKSQKVKIQNPLDRFTFVSGIGCSGWILSPHLDADTIHTTHGRPIPVATGVKVANPNLKVIVVSGDGDLASIGGNHLLHAARRNVELMCVLVNNFNFGMTGGQCGPTTFHDAITSTTPFGNFEYPFNVAEVVAAAGAGYSARWTVRHVLQLEKSFQTAMERSEDGFAFVEVLSPCTTQFEKRNYNTEDPQLLFDLFKTNSINIKDKDKYSADDLNDKFILGDFADRKVEGLTKTINGIKLRACGNSKATSAKGGKK
jgi:2-oxoglutarate ferredoxin oxidoreductase subunit beta